MIAKAKSKPAAKKATAEKGRGSKSAAAERPLTNKQRVFVEEYLTCWNATEAARIAGYSEPNTQGPRMLVNVGISKHIEKRISEIAMSADEVLLRLGEIARGSLKPFVRNDDEDVWPDLTSEAAQEKFHLLKKIKPKRRVGGMPGMEWTETEVELEIHDPMKALELLGKHHKLFTDKTELTGANGGAIEISAIIDAGIEKVFGDDGSSSGAED